MSEENRIPESEQSDTVRRKTYPPRLMIPFKYTQEDAIAACNAYYKNRPLLPSPLQKEVTEEEMQGGFVPFLLYTGTARFDVTYEAQDTQKVEGDPKVTRQIRDYLVHRAGDASYHRIRVNASKDVPDAFLKNIGAYTYRDLQPLEGTQEASLLNDMTEIEENPERTEDVLNHAFQEQLQKTVRHNYIEETKHTFDYTHDETECALFPLWMRIIKVGRRYYHFAMNGQTGEFYGDLPVSQAKSMGCFAGFFLLGAGISYLLMWLFLHLAGTPLSSCQQYVALASVILGFIVTNHFTSVLFRKTHRKEDLKKAKDAEKNNANASIRLLKFTDETDRLIRRQMVNKRNIAIKTEEYESH